MAELENLVEQLSKLTLLEAAELTKMLEEKWGVSAAAPMAMAMAAGPAAGAGAGEAVEEKTQFTVVLKEVGPKKIDVIKAIRQVTSLGLKEAKDLAEASGSKVVDMVSKDVAMDAKAKLEAAGAKVELS